MCRLIAAVILGFAMILAGAASASAHRLDEYLQAMRVDMRAEGILLELDLTPGASLAPDILSVLDPDDDGEIDSARSDAYVREVLRNMQLTIDGQPAPLAMVSRQFPSSDDLRAGSGVISLVAKADFAHAAGPHRLFVDNGFRRDASVYLANALRPDSGALRIASQGRDQRQQTLTVDYVVGTHLLTPASASWTVAAVVLIGCAYWRRRQPLANT